jgi:hypothetical protein
VQCENVCEIKSRLHFSKHQQRLENENNFKFTRAINLFFEFAVDLSKQEAENKNDIQRGLAKSGAEVFY